jgi:Toprim-like/CHC2 zinc finger
MTLEEMTDTLSRLGIETLNSRGDEINSYCAAHEERTGHVDHNPSWWINADSGAFICFSCGWKGNLYSLISYVENIEINAAKDWLGSTASLTSRFQKLFKIKRSPIEEVTKVEESMLGAYTEVPVLAAQDRGLAIVECNRYGVKWNPTFERWIIPIREPLTNKLLGWQEKGHAERYFKNVPAGMKKGISLFGYAQYTGENMIVVESPLDVVRLASVGVMGGVATYGATVSKEQFNLIKGADRIIFAMDNDDAGKAASKDLLYRCQEAGIECWFFNYGDVDVKDVGAMSKSEIMAGLIAATHMLRGIK